MANNGFHNNWDEKFNNVSSRIKSPQNNPEHNQGKLDNAINNVTNSIQKFGPKFGNRAVNKLVNSAKNTGKAIMNSDTAKQIQKIIQTTAKIVKVIATNAKLIGIVFAIVVLVYSAVIFGISIGQSVGTSPHYYCDVEATTSVKNSKLYKQYCVRAKGFELENINGHYLVQDGSGPCTDCSMNNMFLRYFTRLDINWYDYLWQQDGQYAIEGQLLTNSIGQESTIRHHLNAYTTATAEQGVDVAHDSVVNGSIHFAELHNKPGYTMANWGYFRDNSLDIEKWNQTYNYYINNKDNSKWVWDLSLPNFGEGSNWCVNWTQKLKLNGLLNVETVILDTGFNQAVLKDMFTNPTICGQAGIVVFYDRDGDASPDHAILVTGYDTQRKEYRVVDPALGTAGGFEGPASSANFCSEAAGVSAMLNSEECKYGTYSICTIVYCKHPSLAIF